MSAPRIGAKLVATACAQRLEALWAIHAQSRQRGVSLVSALFLIVVLASVGVFAVSLGTTQQQIVIFSILENSALAAANAGIEIGASRAMIGNNCPANRNVNLTQAALTGYALTITCAGSIHMVNGSPVRVFQLTSTARRGAYGRPEFVSRSVTRTVSGP